MKIYIEKPCLINEMEKKSIHLNPIFLSMEDVSVSDRLFLLCRGGEDNGNGGIASTIVYESIRTYFNTFADLEKEITADFIEKAIRYAEIKLEEYLEENPERKGVATLGLLYFSSSGVLGACIGPFQILRIRDGEVLFKTKNKCKDGKSLKGNVLQGASLPVNIDIVKIDDIKPNDQFLVCSTEILEHIPEALLSEILSQKNNAEVKMNKIRELYLQKTANYFSACLVPVFDVQYTKNFNQILASFLSAFM
jgi:Serine/threonine protein phosphatase